MHQKNIDIRANPPLVPTTSSKEIQLFLGVSKISNMLKEFPKNFQFVQGVSNISNMLEEFPNNFHFS